MDSIYSYALYFVLSLLHDSLPISKKKKKSKIMGTVNTKFNLIPIKLVKGENKNEDVQGFCLHIW